MNNNHVYDMLVVGGGPGGYTAALYAARAGLDTVVLEKLSAGGQMALTKQIDNYPGFEDGIDGFSLAEKMQKQAERFGVRSEYAEVLRMDLTAVPKLLETSEGIFRGKTVVLATGADPRTLGVAGEAELLGRGVAYCAACDDSRHSAKDIVIQKQRMEDIHLQLAKRIEFLHMGKQVFYRVISIALCPQELLKIHRKHLIVFFIPYAVAFDLLVIDSQH